jgi:hypothetical protein
MEMDDPAERQQSQSDHEQLIGRLIGFDQAKQNANFFLAVLSSVFNIKSFLVCHRPWMPLIVGIS